MDIRAQDISLPVEADHVRNPIAIEINIGKLWRIIPTCPWHGEFLFIDIDTHIDPLLRGAEKRVKNKRKSE